MSLFEINSKATLRRAVQGEAGFSAFAYGDIGSGKSVLIAGLVELGYTVLVLHFGLGPHGLRAAEEYYKSRTKKKDFYRKCDVIEVRDFDELVELESRGFKALESLDDSKEWKAFLESVDVLVLEEINGIQTIIDKNIIPASELAPEPKTGDKDAAYSYWRKQKAGTERFVKAFLALHGPSKTWNKFMTSHDKSRKVEMQGEDRSGVNAPAISGAAIKAILGATDYVVRTFYTYEGLMDDSRRVYLYETVNTDGEALTKVRGQEWPSKVTADPVAFWRVVAKGEPPSILEPRKGIL